MAITEKSTLQENIALASFKVRIRQKLKSGKKSSLTDLTDILPFAEVDQRGQVIAAVAGDSSWRKDKISEVDRRPQCHRALPVVR